MSGHKIAMTTAPWTLAVVRLDAHAPLPPWATSGAFFAVTRTPDELSIVCEAALVPAGNDTVESPWRAFVVAGPLDFALTGVLAAIAIPLAAAGVSIFACSTFDTDYVLVKAARHAEAVKALRAAGLQVDQPSKF